MALRHDQLSLQPHHRHRGVLHLLAASAAADILARGVLCLEGLTLLEYIAVPSGVNSLGEGSSILTGRKKRTKNHEQYLP